MLMSPKTYIMHLTSVADCRQLCFIRLSPAHRDRAVTERLLKPPKDGGDGTGQQPQLLNQTVRSQRNLTIVFRQSSGKYDCHGWTTERTLPSLAICLAISIALSERYTCGTAKIGTRGEVSKFIIPLPTCCGNVIATRNASCALFGKPPKRKNAGERSVGGAEAVS